MKWRVVVWVLLAAVAGAGAWALDYRIKRPYRIRALQETDRLLMLRDAILDFHLDHRRPPDSLQELVPAYASAGLILYHDPASGRARPVRLDVKRATLEWETPLRFTGLWPAERPISVEAPRLPVVRDSITGEAVFLVTQQVVHLPEDAVVLEAEHAQFLTYGWQTEEASTASGQACLHLPEGAGDEMYGGGPVFDPEVRSGDFYNVTRDNRPMEARCLFRAARPGRHQLWVRTMAHRSHCSNIIGVRVNGGDTLRVGHNGTKPYVWLWHHPLDIDLREGVNTIGFLAYQDGVKVDQVVFTPSPLPGSAGMGTMFSSSTNPQPIKELPALTMTLSTPSLVVTGAAAPRAAVYFRKNREGPMQRTLKVAWDQPRGRRRERTYDLRVEAERVLTRVRLTLDMQMPLQRREYLVRCSLFNGDRLEEERTLVFQRSYDWWILGPLPYIPPDRPEHPEPDLDLPYRFAGESYSWSRYSHANTDCFGIMDFGRVYSGRTYDAVQQRTVYAYTQVTVAVAGTYRMKTQSDDDLVVWINGERVITEAHTKYTAIRSAAEHLVPLRGGANHVLFRLNQRSGQWQGAVRFRTKDDQVADIVGVPVHAGLPELTPARGESPRLLHPPGRPHRQT